ncbi:hypothetical protein [Subtercola sp. RTI3]|uniref:hypothetical protein n=1 Tax=Subtercola sp. RTI3 TaxID=3048639 RepID=UPI002B23A582|nr:hypothetical protein [Subtercola sp. RTI3]MEA9983682.1 hypothetical protein [Subtercola sp. RTI3]
MSTAIVGYQASSLTDRVTYANALAQAGQLIPKGLFDPQTGKPSGPKILLVMETGSMLGLHPMAALQSINVVEGKATLSAQLMKSLITNAGHSVSIVKTGTIPGGDYSVTVNATRADNGETHTSTWDIDRGMRAGSVDSYLRNSVTGKFEVRARSSGGKALPWEAYAEVMPVWRAISDVAREGFGDVLFGMYSTEEIRDGIPLADEDEPKEASKDWTTLIAEATTTAELLVIRDDLRISNEGTDELRTSYLERSGAVSRAEAEAANTVDAEVVTDADETAEAEAAEPVGAEPQRQMTAEEFEAYSAAQAYADEV